LIGFKRFDDAVASISGIELARQIKKCEQCIRNTSTTYARLCAPAKEPIISMLGTAPGTRPSTLDSIPGL
jgi:hypothetical protein